MITEKQKEVLKSTHVYINANGISPTVRNLCDLVGVKSSSTIHKYLTELQQEGYITKIDTIPRSIRITVKGSSLLNS